MMRSLVLVAALAACSPPAPSTPDGATDVETPTFTPCDASTQCMGSATPHRAAPMCRAGVCVRLCAEGWADCNGVAADGCEYDTRDGGFCP